MSDHTRLSWRGWIAMILFMGATVFPAQAMAGFGGFTFGLGWMGLIVLSIIVGAISGLIFDRWHPVARVVAGMIGGPCVTLAIFAWCNGRQEIWNVEVMFVGIAAMLPGLGVGWVLTKLLDDPNAGSSAYAPQQGYPPYYPAQPYEQQAYGQQPYGQNAYPPPNPYAPAQPQYPPPQGAQPFSFPSNPQNPMPPRQP
jgi:Na+/proline symporter